MIYILNNGFQFQKGLIILDNFKYLKLSKWKIFSVFIFILKSFATDETCLFALT